VREIPPFRSSPTKREGASQESTPDVAPAGPAGPADGATAAVPAASASARKPAVIQYGGPTPNRPGGRGAGGMALDDWQEEDTPRAAGAAGTPSSRSPHNSQRKSSREGAPADGSGGDEVSPTRRRLSSATPPPNPFAPNSV
jgi:hypothetical protein